MVATRGTTTTNKPTGQFPVPVSATESAPAQAGHGGGGASAPGGGCEVPGGGPGGGGGGPLGG